MRSNYKLLGEYIQEVKKRNIDLNVTELIGLSTQKEFRTSISNTIGTDMSTYKVIGYNNFVYMPVTDTWKGLAVALYRYHEPKIVSQIYKVFEILDKNLLNPEYLMMWFRRLEIDRYARFKSHGSAREIFDWEEMCNMQLPVPHPDKQKEIVAEYNTIQNRITLNQQLIQKLEETAHAIYKQWFVEFEFPNEDGKSYKSSGGEMVESELGEIPKGWEVKSFTKVVKMGGGGTPDTTNGDYWNGEFHFFTPADIATSYYCVETEKCVSKQGLKNSSTKLYPKDTVFVTARGTVGAIAIAGNEMTMNQSCYALSGENPYYVHQTTINAIQKLKSEAIGAVFSALVTKDFDEQFVAYPGIELEDEFNSKVSVLYKSILVKTKANQKLEELKSLLLSKLATIE